MAAGIWSIVRNRGLFFCWQQELGWFGFNHVSQCRKWAPTLESQHCAVAVYHSFLSTLFKGFYWSITIRTRNNHLEQTLQITIVYLISPSDQIYQSVSVFFSATYMSIFTNTWPVRVKQVKNHVLFQTLQYLIKKKRKQFNLK